MTNEASEFSNSRKIDSFGLCKKRHNTACEMTLKLLGLSHESYLQF